MSYGLGPLEPPIYEFSPFKLDSDDDLLVSERSPSPEEIKEQPVPTRLYSPMRNLSSLDSSVLDSSEKIKAAWDAIFVSSIVSAPKAVRLPQPQEAHSHNLLKKHSEGSRRFMQRIQSATTVTPPPVSPPPVNRSPLGLEGVSFN